MGEGEDVVVAVAVADTDGVADCVVPTIRGAPEGEGVTFTFTDGAGLLLPLLPSPGEDIGTWPSVVTSPGSAAAGT